MCSIVVFSMNEVDSESMLSVLTNTLSCEVGIITQRKMPRVVPDQRSTFDNDELFRRLSRECEVKFKKFIVGSHILSRKFRQFFEVRDGGVIYNVPLNTDFLTYEFTKERFC